MAKLDTCIREVRQVTSVGARILDSIADLKATFLKVAQENPIKQNR